MYVERVWATLNRGEWNESTPPGTKFELEWDLQFGNNTCPVKLIDVAGQDLRNLFSYERHKKQKNLSEIERDILNYLANSTLVVFVVNLQDFVGEPDVTKRKENEFILKEVIDTFTTDENQQDIIIVFTAYDLYEAEIKKHGNFEQYIKEEFIYLFHAVKNWAKKFHKNGNVNQLFFPVAAVAETEIITGTNTTPRRVPKPNFTSYGINEFSDWIIRKIKKNTEQKEKQQKREEKKHKVTLISRTIINFFQNTGDKIVGGIVYGTFGGFVGGICCGIAGLAVGIIISIIGNILGNEIGGGISACSIFGVKVGLIGGWIVGLVINGITGVTLGWNTARSSPNTVPIVGETIGAIIGLISCGFLAWYNNMEFVNGIFGGIAGGILCGFIGMMVYIMATEKKLDK
jgi:hypothetical protein